MKKFKLTLTIYISLIGLIPIITFALLSHLVSFGYFYFICSVFFTAIIVFYSKSVANWLLKPIENDIEECFKALKGEINDEFIFNNEFDDLSSEKQINFRNIDSNSKAKYSSIEFENLILNIVKMYHKISDMRKHIDEAVDVKTKNIIESEKKILKENSYFKGVFNNLPFGILLINANGDLIGTNNEFKSKFKVDIGTNIKSVEKALIKLFKSEHRYEIEEIFELDDLDDNIENEYEWQLLSNDIVFKINMFPLIHSINKLSKPFAFMFAFQDTTNIINLENELQQAHKISGLGSMAGGLAHDFNNILTTVIGNLDIIEYSLNKEKCDKDLIGAISSAVKASNEGANIARQLLRVSRREKSHREYITLNKIVKNTKVLLKSSIPLKIDIIYELADDLKIIYADTTQLNQCLLNLCLNSRDALNNAKGVIKVSTKNISLKNDSSLIKKHDAKEGDYSVLSVKDNGQGISDDIIEKIFEPLFTTKEKDKGTGFGLSMVKSIVQKHNGFIECQSTLGKGTTFFLYIPVSKNIIDNKHLKSPNIGKDKLASAPPPPPPIVKEKKEKKEFDGKVLIVDDDASLRKVAYTALKRAGYKSLEAENGKVAIEKLTKFSKDIKVIVLDISMPVLSGKETFKIIRDRRNDTPVVMCSGSIIDKASIKSETGYEPEGCLSKPYNFGQLTDAIEEVIYANTDNQTVLI